VGGVPATSTMDRLQLGDHICWTYDDEDVYLSSGVDLRLSGELDLSNRDTLTPVLRDLVNRRAPAEPAGRPSGPIRVNVSALTFTDCAAVALPLTFARSAPDGLELIGCRPNLTRLLTIMDADEIATLTVVREPS